MIQTEANRNRNGIVSCLAVLLWLVTGCGGPSDEATPAVEQRQAQMQFLNMDPTVKYVGEDVCRECHFEEYGTSKKTGMGRAFYPMSADDVVEDFTANNEFVVEESGLHYRMVQRGDQFFQQQFMLDSRGNRIAFDEHKMVWVIGSNHHSRGYVTEQEDKLFQAPVCWYPDESKWELCPGYEFKNDHFAREITHGCIHCHNGVMKLVEGERNLYERPFPHGIGCERCHGAGELHVQRWRSGETPTGEADPTIVHVRRLPQSERIEVCFQCHLGDARASERVHRWDRDFSRYRPGQQITEMVVPLRYVQQTQWDFGLSAQADRLLQSRCYRESGGKIECLTCHNPHITVYHEDRPADHFRLRCLSCHAEGDCVEEAAVRERTAPAQDDCIQCHMRKAEPDDQRFTEFTDHWIRRDIDLEQRDHRDNFEVEPVFPERFARLPEGEQSFYRARAESLLGLDVPVSQQPRVWVMAEKNFEESIELGFDNVYSWFFLGKVRTYQQRWRQAHVAFERAYRHDETHHDAAFAWGQSLVRHKDLNGGLGVFEKMLEQDPGDTMALAEVGRVLSTLGRHEEAIEYYDRAIREEPWLVSLHLNRARVLATMGNFAEAARAAKEIVRLDPDNPDSWIFYEKSHEAAGMMDEALEGRRLVQRLSEVKNYGG